MQLKFSPPHRELLVILGQNSGPGSPQLGREGRRELGLLHKPLLLPPAHSHWELKGHSVLVGGVKVLPAASGRGSSAAALLPLCRWCWRVWRRDRVPECIFLSGVCCFSQQHYAWHCLWFFSTRLCIARGAEMFPEVWLKQRYQPVLHPPGAQFQPPAALLALLSMILNTGRSVSLTNTFAEEWSCYEQVTRTCRGWLCHRWLLKDWSDRWYKCTRHFKSGALLFRAKRNAAQPVERGLEARSGSVAGTTPASCRSKFLPPTCFAFAQVRC